jgi:hypothetical protein
MLDRARMLRHARTAARLGATMSVLALVAVTAAWDAARPAPPAQLTLLYVGAADCAPCRTWQAGDGRRFRESGEFAGVRYREVKSPTLRGVLDDEFWPEDLRGYRARLGRGAGVPLWLVIGDREILATGFGAAQWRSTVLPQLRSLTR